MKKKIITNKIVIYQTKTGAIELKGDFQRETIWATQAQIAKIFNVTPQNITLHLSNIFKENELSAVSTCKELLQVQKEGGREIKRKVLVYNLDAIIAVGYRINSLVGTKFRQWATKTLRQYITQGYAINKNRVAKNYDQFISAVENIKMLLPDGGQIDANSTLELVKAFADTWLSLDAYDKDTLIASGATKRTVLITAEQLISALADFKSELLKRHEATEIFGQEQYKETIAGIVGNTMQSFGGKPVYPTIEEKAAHLLYFIVKNHPFIDGNKRSGAYAFVWFLKKAGILNASKITPPALTALTLFIAESNPKHKEKMIRLVLQLLKK